MRDDRIPNASDAVKFFKDFGVGAGAAAAAKTIIAPVERVKLILQVNVAVFIFVLLFVCMWSEHLHFLPVK